MAVQAKFKVHEITEHEYGKERMKTIRLIPVSSDKEGSENRRFWAATPNGEIRLGTINMDAAAQFELGAEYYVTFTPAQPEESEIYDPASGPIR